VRVLVVHPWIRVGGAETLILQVARELTAMGHQVRIATCYAQTSRLAEDFGDLDFILPWRWISWLSTKSLWLISLFGGPALLWQTIRHAGDCDVIYPHNFPALWIAWVAGAVRRKPVVWQFNEPTPPPLPAWFTKIDARLARSVRQICVLDSLAAAKVRSLFGREAAIVHPGVDFEFFSTGSGDYAGRVAAKFGLDGRRVLLCLGKIDRQKNQAMLVELLQVLRDEMPDLMLVLVGRGPDEAAISRRAAQLSLGARVVFAGIRDASEVRALYSLAFLVCFPALDQTWGLTPIEALGQGTLSLVSNQAGVSEVLAREDIGLVAEPTPEAFAVMVRHAAAHPDLVRDMALRGRRYAQTQLTWRAFSEGILHELQGGVHEIAPV
jgi:glycosyltransferase involved in cell wall biosynthesis